MNLTQDQELYTQVVEKAWEDAEFKAKLVANPVKAIEALTGQKFELPEGKTLVVRDQTAESTFFFNIPVDKNNPDMELTEEQLEAVAGGRGIPLYTDKFQTPVCWFKDYDFPTFEK